MRHKHVCYYFQAWNTIVKQTEAIQKVLQQNTDRMCTKTLESLITLISDKRTARKTYADERQRLEVEFAKVGSFAFPSKKNQKNNNNNKTRFAMRNETV